jgi:hypothetical protein
MMEFGPGQAHGRLGERSARRPGQARMAKLFPELRYPFTRPCRPAQGTWPGHARALPGCSRNLAKPRSAWPTCSSCLTKIQQANACIFCKLDLTVKTREPSPKAMSIPLAEGERMNLLRPWPGHSSPVADSSARRPPEYYAFSSVLVCLLTVKLTAVAAGPEPPDLRPHEPHVALRNLLLSRRKLWNLLTFIPSIIP